MSSTVRAAARDPRRQLRSMSSGSRPRLRRRVPRPAAHHQPRSPHQPHSFAHNHHPVAIIAEVMAYTEELGNYSCPRGSSAEAGSSALMGRRCISGGCGTTGCVGTRRRPDQPGHSARKCCQSGFSARNRCACSSPAAARSRSLDSQPCRRRRASASPSSAVPPHGPVPPQGARFTPWSAFRLMEPVPPQGARSAPWNPRPTLVRSDQVPAGQGRAARTARWSDMSVSSSSGRASVRPARTMDRTSASVAPARARYVSGGTDGHSG
jgi:hypothetical protein